MKYFFKSVFNLTSLKSRRLRKLLDLLLPLTSHSLLILHFPVNAYLVQSMTFQLNGLIESIIPWYNLYDFYISTFDISNVNYIHYQLLTRPHTWVIASTRLQNTILRVSLFSKCTPEAHARDRRRI